MWNLVSGSKICFERKRTREQNRHMRNIYKAKARINTRKPKKPKFLVSRQRQKRMKEDMKNTIYKHNQILLNKMIEIEKKIGPLNPESLRQKYFTKDSMNIEFRKRQMFEVNKSNRGMLRRLQSAKSNHSIHKWKRHDAKHLYLKYNIMRNARRNEHTDYAQRNFPQVSGGGMKSGRSRIQTAKERTTAQNILKTLNSNMQRPFSAPKYSKKGNKSKRSQLQPINATVEEPIGQ